MMIHRVLGPSEVIVERESTERGGFSSVESCWEDTLILNTCEGSPNARVDDGCLTFSCDTPGKKIAFQLTQIGVARR